MRIVLCKKGVVIRSLVRPSTEHHQHGIFIRLDRCYRRRAMRPVVQQMKGLVFSNCLRNVR